MTAPGPLLVLADTPDTAGDFREVLGLSGEPQGSLDGWRVEWAVGCEQAIGLVTRGIERQSPYPVALVDLSPALGESGIETVARLWEADPRLQVVFCGVEASQAAEQFRGEPRLLLLKKPLSPLEIVQAVGILAAKWELERRSERMGDLEALARRRGDEIDSLSADLERARRETDAAMQALGEKVGAILGSNGTAGEADTLPGISIALGLEYCGDDRELLRSLMEKFLKRREAATEIAAALARGGREEAQRGAHTLISPAATIGADLLARAARAMEEGIRDRDGERLPPLLERLGRELNRVMGSIDRYLAQQPNQAGPGGPDRAKVKGLLEQMTSLFESDLGAALSVKDELRRELRGTHLFEQFSRLEHLVDSFDFDGAAKARERLEEMLESAPAVPEEKP
ncbi:Hpt domain-containing protein [Geomonas sp. Red32]|uniref:Hpt domain-containing protein n=1 Tax=Geomonas sp. Red32 TaxID=2912856 RepID=UPI00202CFED3|nr:Hpt domain-containing protein [Geomonas sp. Red32]MCM0082896.1 Hpt domain-containing protein [Geomonas sp. Red32]